MNEQKWKKENKDLKEKMRHMKIENDMLQSQLEELACKEESSKRINSKNDEKTYNVACRKAVYCCLEYHVPITNISPVIEGVLRENDNIWAVSRLHCWGS